MLFKIEKHIHHHVHLKEYENIMTILEDLRREVTESRDASQSAIILIQGMKAKLDELLANAATHQELINGIQSLSQELSDSTDQLGAAVAANTPADPNPPVDPETPVEPDPGAGEGGEGDPTGRL